MTHDDEPTREEFAVPYNPDDRIILLSQDESPHYTVWYEAPNAWNRSEIAATSAREFDTRNRATAYIESLQRESPREELPNA